MTLRDDRYFDPNSRQKEVALQLYERVQDLPLVCPHTHVPAAIFADPAYTFGSPVDIFVIPDHYIFRMLYSQGIRLENLGIPRRDGESVEENHRRIWQIFGEHFYLFRGTPTGMWLVHELQSVFDVHEPLNGDTAPAIYDQIAAKLQTSAFRPRRLYEDFNIDVLCTSDPATSTLTHHRTIRDSAWKGRILPTFRPDGVIHIDRSTWRSNIDTLSAVTGINIDGYASYIDALEHQRSIFKKMGATATDHSTLEPYTEPLSRQDAGDLFQRALRGEASAEDARRFGGHMLIEMARMSADDSLVMQLHAGSYRNHNPLLYRRFGRDIGADIPVAVDFTRGLKPLLDRFGNDSSFTLILFTLDETTYSRELAPLAGHYPAVTLGPPWWFHDSWNGMMRFRRRVMETAGLYNTAGFNDDTRAFPSIPARHDLARRADANWIANMVVRGVIDMHAAEEMMQAAASDLARDAYNLA